MCTLILTLQIVVNEDGVNSLIILGASRYDTGTYKCVAKNKAGENSFTVKLKVMGKWEDYLKNALCVQLC